MNFLDLYNAKGGALNALSIDDVLKYNEISQKFGLLLNRIEAHELIQARNRALRSHGRVELGIGVIEKIINAFSSSSYINQGDYAALLNEFVELFYYMKNETEDRLGDDELITLMKNFFNDSSRGSLDLLKSKDLADFARNFRETNQALDLAKKEEA